MSLPARARGHQAVRHGPLRSTFLRASLVVAASSGIALLAAACSGPTAASPATQGAAGGTTAHNAARKAAYPAPTSAQNGAGTYAGSSAPRGGAEVALSTQSIIYTAQITMRTKHVTAAAASAITLITAVGGYVADEQQIIPRSGGGIPQVTLVLKIPVSQYHAIFAKIAALGRPITSSQHAQDVTQEVADVGSRVDSAEAAIKQLRALLGKAGSVGALLQVQDEINTQEAQLEALLAQQRALAHETSYATVTALLVGPHVKVVKKHKKKAGGFIGGLKAGWHALVLVVRAVLTALGAALPFAIPVAVLALIGWQGRRRLTRRRQPAAAEPPPAQT